MKFLSSPPRLLGDVGEPSRKTVSLRELRSLMPEPSRYEVLRELGRGGFASIFLARDQLLEQELALKVPHAWGPEAEWNWELIRSTCASWAAISRDAPATVARLHDLLGPIHVDGATTGIMVMEYVAGGTLAEFGNTRWGGPPRNFHQVRTVLRFFRQACYAIRQVHRRGYLHRDLKPENFVVDESGAGCKVVDFESLMAIGKTLPLGARAGTPEFCAPECSDGEYSIQSDIFALGTTLCLLLTGNLPSTARTYHPAIPVALVALVSRCTAVDPRHRPRSADDILTDLARSGFYEKRGTVAPTALMRLLASTMDERELEEVAADLSSQRAVAGYDGQGDAAAAVVQQACHLVPPRELLNDHCTKRHLRAMMVALGVEHDRAASRRDQISTVLDAVGFLVAPERSVGISRALSSCRMHEKRLSQGATLEELVGVTQVCFGHLEQCVALLLSFYGQAVYGSGFRAFLQGHADGKPTARLTLGQRLQALRGVCTKPPTFALAPALVEALSWPILPASLLRELSRLGSLRNEFAHGRVGFASRDDSHRLAHDTASGVAAVLETLHSIGHVPVVVEIVAAVEDEFGRMSFTCRGEMGNVERIFTPVPLRVGEPYAMLSRGKHVHVDPQIHPIEGQHPRSH